MLNLTDDAAGIGTIGMMQGGLRPMEADIEAEAQAVGLFIELHPATQLCLVAEFSADSLPGSSCPARSKP